MSRSYLTVIFEASGIEEDKLLNRVLSVTREIKTIIDDFVRNSNESNLYSKDLQIVSLNTILLKILQHNTLDFHHKEINIPVNQNYQNNFLEEIIAYIHNNIYKPLTVADICHEFSISRTYLQRIFNETLHVTPKSILLKQNWPKQNIDKKTVTIH